MTTVNEVIEAIRSLPPLDRPMPPVADKSVVSIFEVEKLRKTLMEEFTMKYATGSEEYLLAVYGAAQALRRLKKFL